jgi:hypothetical protein
VTGRKPLLDAIHTAAGVSASNFVLSPETARTEAARYRFARRQPAACASSSEQNHRSPLASSMRVCS